jgi:hypothetical protein
MKYLKNFEPFVEGLAGTNYDIPDIIRCKDLSEEEFLNILNTNCKNFSFQNDLLWRSKGKRGGDLQLFEPNLRRADPLAFPKFFNKIKDDPNFPVKRQKSLIGVSDKEILKKLVGEEMWLVIPFDESQIIFCPIVDLWALDDQRMKKSEKVGGRDVSEENFIMKTYTSNFQIPLSELERLRNANIKNGVEFFTSSPCLLVHESKVNWLRNKL